MGRRSEHSREELQELIIDATLVLVTEKGAQEVTARQIAKAVGYTPGMLYSVFLNQSDIFQHVNSRSLEALYQQCLRASESDDEPVASITAMGEAYLAFARDHTHQFDLLFNRTLAYSEAQVQSALRSRINTMFGLVEHRLMDLAPGSDAQQVRLAASALWSGVHGIAALSLSEQLYLDQPRAEQEILRTLVTGFTDSWKD